MLNLVIGAPGFVAMHLIEALLVRGETVRALVRPGAHISRLAELNVQVRTTPLTDNAGLMSAAADVERLYFCEWGLQDWGAEVLAEDLATRGLRNVLAMATRLKIPKLVYLSTTDVYGYPGVPIRESKQLSPPGLPHADIKAQAERLVWDHIRRVQLPAVVLRPATIYGPGSQVFVLDILQRLRDRRMFLVDEGQYIAGLTYVGNLVRAMLLAADSDEGIGEAYNITDDSKITWREYVHALATLAELPPPQKSYSRGWAMTLAAIWEGFYQLMGRDQRPPMTRLMVEIMSVNQEYPIDKARKELGYVPHVTFEQGLRETSDWLHQEDLLGW